MEEVSELRKSEQLTYLMYRIVAWVSGITILTVIAYGVISTLESSGSVVSVGATLVNVEFPLPMLAKPVTYLSIASVTFFYSSLRVWEHKIARWSRVKLSALQLFAIVVAFASAYEVLYNFMIWGAIFSGQYVKGILNPSVLSGPADVSGIPWNLVFATKMFSALLVIAGYSAYFLRKLHSRSERPLEI
jgi:hypothetical protein